MLVGTSQSFAALQFFSGCCTQCKGAQYNRLLFSIRTGVSCLLWRARTMDIATFIPHSLKSSPREGQVPFGTFMAASVLITSVVAPHVRVRNEATNCRLELSPQHCSAHHIKPCTSIL